MLNNIIYIYTTSLSGRTTPTSHETNLQRRCRRSNGFHVALAAGTTRYNMNVSMKNGVKLASRRPAVQLVH